MGFLETSRSLRRQDKDSRKRSATVSAAQPNMTDLEARGRGGPTVPKYSRDSSMQPNSRPRTAGRVLGTNEALPPPPSIDILSGEHAFRFPTPSPRQSSSSMTFHRSSTTIGIALGSPRQIPGYKRSLTTPIVPQATVENGLIKISAKLSGVEDPSPTLSDPKGEKQSKQPTLHKSKSSTWKSFFQRKQPRPAMPESFDRNELPPFPGHNKPMSSEPKQLSARKDAQQAEAPASHGRGESRGDFRRHMRAELDKAHFSKSLPSPAVSKVAQSKFSTLVRPAPSRNATATSELSQEYFDAVSQIDSSSVSSSNPSPNQAPSMPRLDISIPDVGMERYSVMFEKLLKPQQSIMERRQTYIKKLQLVEGPTGGLTPSLETPSRMQRRATSPNLAVHTPLTAETLETSSQMATPVPIYRASGGPRLLQRSKTAPPGVLTPARQQFYDQQRTANTSTAGSETSPLWSESSLPPTPSTASDAETFVSFDYGGSDDEEVEIVTYHQAKTMMPNFKTPGWEMPTPTKTPVAAAAAAATTITTTTTTTKAPPIPPKAPGRANSPPRNLSPPRLNGLQQHPPRTSSLGNDEHKIRQHHHHHQQEKQQSQQQQKQSQPLNKGPVQISIARQVSVARRRPGGQNQTQGPSPPQKTRSFSPNRSEPAPVFSKQPLRPKVVEVRNRKSTIVVLDSA